MTFYDIFPNGCDSFYSVMPLGLFVFVFLKEKYHKQTNRGDINARTSTLPDYVYENERDANFIIFPDNYEVDQFTTLRNNQDIHTNS